MRKLLARLRTADMRAAIADNEVLINEAKHQLREQTESLHPENANQQQQSRQLLAAYQAVDIDIVMHAATPVLTAFLLEQGISSSRDDSAIRQGAPR